jgi:CHAD domain-containing protein
MGLASRLSADEPRNIPESPADDRPSIADFPSLAERLIRDRLEALLAHYRPAVERPGDDDEAVHQLRVWSRRLTAALQTLQPLLPAAPREKLIRNLKAVRRAAGPARDLDVFRDRVKSSEFSLKRKARKRVLKFLKKRRKKAQKPLRKSFRKRPPEKLRRRVDELVATLQSETGELPVCGSSLVQTAIDRFSVDGPAAFETAAELHQLRIAAKRLRYTLETLLDLHAIPRREEVGRLLDEQKQIQDRLGKINDHAVSQRRLIDWAEEAPRETLRKSFVQMADEESTQAAERTADFLRWWSEDRQQSFRCRLDALVRSDRLQRGS